MIANALRQRGVTLVELLISIVLALLVMLGLVTLVNTVGVTNRTQDGMARMQENGRYAIDRIAQDIRAASSQYCSNFSAAASELYVGGFSYNDRTRPITAHYHVNATGNDYVPPSPNPTSPIVFGPTLGAAPAANYLINNKYMLYGSECTNAACTPALTGVDRGFDPSIIATMGIAAGNRARGADVLTMRYLRGEGVAITAIANERVDGQPVRINADTTALGMAGPGQAWITDCSVSDVMRVNATAGLLTASGNITDDTLNRVDITRDARVFNLLTDLTRVSYYLRVNDDTDPGRRPTDRKIVSLMRNENGNVQEIVQGVERLDFLYGIEDSFGRTRYLTAAEVDGLSTDAQCPPVPALPFGFVKSYWQANPFYSGAAGGAPVFSQAFREPGCGWRAVRSIEVAMLLNSATDAAVANDEQFRYSWLNDGTVNAANAFENPATLGTLRNGLPPYRMLRREFRTLVALRSYNY